MKYSDRVFAKEEPINSWKDRCSILLSETWKLELSGVTTICSLGRLTLKRSIPSNVGEDEKQLDLSYVANMSL